MATSTALPALPSPSRLSDRLTGPRIYASASRISRAYAHVSAGIGITFGESSAATIALAARVGELIAATAGLTPYYSAAVLSCLRLDLANVPRLAARVHQLAVWLLAAAQAMESDDAEVARLAVALGVLVAECEFIASANATAIPHISVSGSDDEEEEAEEAAAAPGEAA
jgi:hypothetical protein